MQLTRAAKDVARAFDDMLTSSGGSLPVWLILLSHQSLQLGNQRELAEMIGITEATLTHHLNAMEADGLLTRRRDPTNRRHHIVELTGQGEAMFERLRDAALAFDRRLRAGIGADDLATLRLLLARMSANVSGDRR